MKKVLCLSLFASLFLNAEDVSLKIADKFDVSIQEVKVAKEKLPPYLVVPDDEIRRVALQNKLFTKEYLLNDKISEDDIIYIQNEFEKYISQKYQKKLLDGVDTNESVLKSYYLDHVDSFKFAPNVESSVIVLNNLKDAMDVFYDLRDKKGDFAKLAKEKSVEPSGANGGKLPLAPMDAFLPPLRAFLEGAKEGDISEPIKVYDKYQIIKVEKIVNQDTNYESMKDKIRDILISKVKIEILKKENDKLKEKHMEAK